jgi:hypothetical protein
MDWPPIKSLAQFSIVGGRMPQKTEFTQHLSSYGNPAEHKDTVIGIASSASLPMPTERMAKLQMK